MNEELIKHAAEVLNMPQLLDMLNAVHDNRCPFCKQVIFKDDFRDERARREFQVSSLCQKCQDEVFGV